MTYSLDTDVVVDLLRGRHPLVRLRFDDAIELGAQIRLCSVVFHELVHGALSSARREHQLASLDLLLRPIPIEPWSADDAFSAADIRARLDRLGQPIGGFDALIAGQALNRGWTVVTGNRREFARIDGLTTIDWRKEQ
ncbi:MAG: PIN domain-containing protein [Caulobacteraceae bacterium]